MSSCSLTSLIRSALSLKEQAQQKHFSLRWRQRGHDGTDDGAHTVDQCVEGLGIDANGLFFSRFFRFPWVPFIDLGCGNAIVC